MAPPPANHPRTLSSQIFYAMDSEMPQDDTEKRLGDYPRTTSNDIAERDEIPDINNST